MEGVRHIFKAAPKTVWAACLAFAFAASLAAAPGPKIPPHVESLSRFKIPLEKSSKLQILIPPEHTQGELEAARLLKKYLCLHSKNLEVKISSQASPGFGKTITLSKDPEAHEISPSLSDFSKTVSNTVNISRDKVEILYCSSPQNAAGDFLRMAGFRFYTPGELGTIAPIGPISLKAGKRLFEPKFLHVGIFGAGDREWLALNGERSVLPNFSHNLFKIFDQKAMDSNPEFKAKVRKFQNPKKAQPNFSADGASRFAAEKACEYFEKNPKSRSFSVGINDTLIFDTRTRQNGEPLEFFRNYPNYSNAYFDFAAGAARLVSQKFPEKFIGCLAYLSTESVPEFALPPNLYPVLTSDRSANFDPKKREEDFRLMELWAASGAKVAGIYDYLNGAPYHVPRSTEKFVWEGILKAGKLGFKSYFAETSPDWPYDGARLWVAMRILNGSPQTPRELEKNFYKDMYPDSHDAVEAFMGEAKSAWENRSDTPHWISFYKRDSAAELFPPERLEKMENFLREAESLASESAEKMRLFQLRLSFEVTKAFCRHFQAQKTLSATDANAPAREILNALKNAKEAERRFENMRTARNALKAYKTPANFYKLEFEGPTDSLALAAFKKASDAEKEELKSIIGAEEYAKTAKASGNRQTVFATSFSYPDFASDERGIREFPEIFRTRCVPKKNSDFRLAKSASGSFVQIMECTYAEISHFEKISEGKTYSFGFAFQGRISMGTTAYASLLFLDGNGKIAARREVSVPRSGKTENGNFEITLKAPQGAKSAAVAIIVWDMHDSKDFLRITSMSLEECAD